jgi:hypothetical protein
LSFILSFFYNACPQWRPISASTCRKMSYRRFSSCALTSRSRLTRLHKGYRLSPTTICIFTVSGLRPSGGPFHCSNRKGRKRLKA